MEKMVRWGCSAGETGPVGAGLLKRKQDKRRSEVSNVYAKT